MATTNNVQADLQLANQQCTTLRQTKVSICPKGLYHSSEAINKLGGHHRGIEVLLVLPKLKVTLDTSLENGVTCLSLRISLW